MWFTCKCVVARPCSQWRREWEEREGQRWKDIESRLQCISVRDRAKVKLPTASFWSGKAADFIWPLVDSYDVCLHVSFLQCVCCCHTVSCDWLFVIPPSPLLRWPGVVRSVPQATDLPVLKGLRSRDSPLLSLRPSLPLLWWNWARCTSLDHSKAIKWPLSAVASVVLWCQLSSSFCRCIFLFFFFYWHMGTSLCAVCYVCTHTVHGCVLTVTFCTWASLAFLLFSRWDASSHLIIFFCGKCMQNT